MITVLSYQTVVYCIGSVSQKDFESLFGLLNFRHTEHQFITKQERESFDAEFFRSTLYSILFVVYNVNGVAIISTHCHNFLNELQSDFAGI